LPQSSSGDHITFHAVSITLGRRFLKNGVGNVQRSHWSMDRFAHEMLQQQQ